MVSFFPEQGRLTVKAGLKDTFFLRPPHWAPREDVRAFVNARAVPVNWSGSYVRFDADAGEELTMTYPLIRFTHEVEGLWPTGGPELKMTFTWLGNRVLDAAPAGGPTPLFTGKPRILPPVPKGTA